MLTKVTYSPYSAVIAKGEFIFPESKTMLIEKETDTYKITTSDGAVDIELTLTPSQVGELLLFFRNISK